MYIHTYGYIYRYIYMGIYSYIPICIYLPLYIYMYMYIWVSLNVRAWGLSSKPSEAPAFVPHARPWRLAPTHPGSLQVGPCRSSSAKRPTQVVFPPRGFIRGPASTYTQHHHALGPQYTPYSIHADSLWEVGIPGVLGYL